MNIQNNLREFGKFLKDFKKSEPLRHSGIALLLLSSMLFPFGMAAQTLFGVVRDADNGQPLGGVSFVLKFEPTSKKSAQGPFERSMVSDGAGAFRFEGLTPGYYHASISAQGYETQTLLEINVAAGKEQTLYFDLRPSTTGLPLVTITSEPAGRRQQALSEISLTQEQTLRFPATFYDPARLAMAYPGVANNDDQANGLIVRGNNPASLRWRLEGVDVVNPNHQPNAGTFSDRPAAAAGGVLMFSAQLLDNSALLTGAYPAGYGDATGGIMDMFLRRGNTQQREFTAQLGLIGLDVAAEGPFNKKKNSSYLANYRYSTVGLLGQMGVSFGNEQINFQDFSFKLSQQDRRGGEWTFFGLGGLSTNLFKPQSDSADVRQYKDLLTIDFGSRTGVLGLTYSGLLAGGTRFKCSAVWSAQDSHREATGLGLSDYDEQVESRTGLSFSFFRKLNSQNRLSAGALSQLIGYSGEATANAQATVYSGEVKMLSLQPWANWEWTSRNERWNSHVGLHSQIVRYINGPGTISPLLEPRLSMGWRPNAKQRLTLAYGYNGQLNPLWYLAEKRLDVLPSVQFLHRDQGLVRAHHLGLKYAHTLRNNWLFKTEIFWQWLRDIPVAAVGPSTLSLLNVSELRSFPGLQAKGTGENKGIECSLDRHFSKGWFIAANTTLFRSRYTDVAGNQLATRWDLGHIANLTTGKEWMIRNKGERYRHFGFDVRFVWAGGQKAMPVDAVASALRQTTVFEEDKGFSLRQPDFFRVDLRVYWKRNLGDRRNSTFSMDFQNATMQQNTAYQYYDPFTKKVETKYQLGLIPNLTWRLEF